MKILMVADVPPNPDSGAAGTEYQTMIALRALGHEVDALWSGDLRHRIRHGNLHYLLELPWAYRDAIRDRTATNDYDVILVNQPYAWLAARDHRLRRGPGVFVNRSHGWEPRVGEVLRPWRRNYKVPEWRFPRGLVGRPIQWALRAYPPWCVDASDGVIVSCQEDRDYIIQNYHVPDYKVVCIPQAPADIFVNSPAPPMTPARARKVLYAGQAAFFKAPQVLAAVFSRLAERHPALAFTWCCPTSAHGFCRGLLSEGARSRTTMVGWLPQQQLVELYDRNGIFLFPSFTEGFGKVFLEAMARGLCVVASNTAGMRDVIRSGENGWLVEPGDEEGFCSAAENVICSEQSRRMSHAAAAVARTYSWQRVAVETSDYYRALLDRKHPAR